MPRRRWWRWFLRGLLVLVALTAGQHWHVVVSGRAHTFALASVPAADAIVVPGARILADGTPYSMLVDRLALARDLFAAGKAPVVLLSGRGGGGLAVDEVAAMRRWLLANGVPASALRFDPLGLRTLDTMRRCRDAFGLRSVIVATNAFHVDRAVFLGRQCGLDARGVAAPALVGYTNGTLARNHGREVLARVWAWWDVFVFGAAG